MKIKSMYTELFVGVTEEHYSSGGIPMERSAFIVE